MTAYPIVSNCNYESAEDTTIHQIRTALDAGLTSDETLCKAMAQLEETLVEELDDDGEHERGLASKQLIDEAEQAVCAAWTTEVQASVDGMLNSRKCK